MAKMDLNTMSVTELKALAYDLIASAEELQNQLNKVNEVIRRKQAPSEVVAAPSGDEEQLKDTDAPETTKVK